MAVLALLSALTASFFHTAAADEPLPPQAPPFQADPVQTMVTRGNLIDSLYQAALADKDPERLFHYLKETSPQTLEKLRRVREEFRVRGEKPSLIEQLKQLSDPSKTNLEELFLGIDFESLRRRAGDLFERDLIGAFGNLVSKQETLRTHVAGNPFVHLPTYCAHAARELGKRKAVTPEWLAEFSIRSLSTLPTQRMLFGERARDIGFFRLDQLVGALQRLEKTAAGGKPTDELSADVEKLVTEIYDLKPNDFEAFMRVLALKRIANKSPSADLLYTKLLKDMDRFLGSGFTFDPGFFAVGAGSALVGVGLFYGGAALVTHCALGASGGAAVLRGAGVAALRWHLRYGARIAARKVLVGAVAGGAVLGPTAYYGWPDDEWGKLRNNDGFIGFNRWRMKYASPVTLIQDFEKEYRLRARQMGPFFLETCGPAPFQEAAPTQKAVPK